MGVLTLNWHMVISKICVYFWPFWEQAAHNPDPDKCKLFDVLHTYLLDKRQEQIINNKHFVI